jgi:hypothetical protein
MRRACLLALLAVLFTIVPVSATAATELPGGKANFVVSTGNLTTGTRTGWVRLGTYAFDSAAGTVSARMHVWQQSSPQPRTGIGTTPDSTCSTTAGSSTSKVRTCEIKTAGGFTGNPTDLRSGGYELRTENGRPIVWISWSGSSPWTEKWAIDTQPGLTKLSFVYSTKASTGYGYGSNAALSSRRAMSSVQGMPGTIQLSGSTWSGDNVTTTAPSVFQHHSFRTCTTTTWCLTMLQPTSSKACQKDGGCPTYGGGTAANVSSIQYYIGRVSNDDRRDTLWHWCTCLAMEHGEFCYTGNSHVKPMLQILDDSASFRGWVGVEASYNPYGGSDPRANDMLGVFQLTDWTPA